MKGNRVAVTREHFPEKRDERKGGEQTRGRQEDGRVKRGFADASRYSSRPTVFLRIFYPTRKFHGNHSKLR